MSSSSASCFFQAEEGIRDPCVTGVYRCCFFFSSRRRHTRSLCDWSSDVCSSDLSTVGASQRGDTIYSTYLGIAANVPVAQQRFEAAYTWNRSKFQEFGNLDYTGHTARAAWDYNLQNKVTGVLSYNESQGLASFNNIQANEKDLVTVRQAQGTAAWLVTPRWRMDGRLTGVQTEHTNVVRSINDIESEGAEAGLSYVTPQENLVGGSVRYEHGKSPHGN